MENFVNKTPFFADTVEKRIDLLKKMNSLVGSVDDESYYYDEWIQFVPDQADEDDFKTIAEDEELWQNTVNSFLWIMKEIY